ncbi:MAG TPA: acetyl-CoA carboxylase biotin carboxyl carrier protein [Solirubrobacteraceae bacterium]|jgi:acetyl-CoA carboxylase biotin carboxyl carrier protein
MGLTDADVREILRIIDESEDLNELSIETDGFRLHVRKGDVAADARSGGVLPRTPPERAPASPAAPPSPPAPDDGLVTVPSPMLGTFYRAEAPGADPFVELGATVEPDTTVCIIEVMKMMNSVPAGLGGTIAEIVAENGQLVEYGDPLFRVTPEG